MKPIKRKSVITPQSGVKTSRTIYKIEKIKTDLSIPEAAASKVSEQVQKIRNAWNPQNEREMALQEVIFLELMRFLYPSADNPCPKARFIISTTAEVRVGLVGTPDKIPEELTQEKLSEWVTTFTDTSTLDLPMKDMILASFYSTVFGAGDAKHGNFMVLANGHTIIHDGEFLNFFTPSLENFIQSPFLKMTPGINRIPHNFLFNYYLSVFSEGDIVKDLYKNPEIQKIKWQALVKMALISPELLEKLIVCKNPGTETADYLDALKSRVRTFFQDSLDRAREYLFKIPEAVLYLASEECQKDYSTWMEAREAHVFSSKDKMTPELSESLKTAFRKLQTRAQRMQTSLALPTTPPPGGLDSDRGHAMGGAGGPLPETPSIPSASPMTESHPSTVFAPPIATTSPPVTTEKPTAGPEATSGP